MSGLVAMEGNQALAAGLGVARKRRRCNGGDERGQAVAEVPVHGAPKGVVVAVAGGDALLFISR